MAFSQSVDLVLGPMQIGYSISTFLFGLATVQTYLYFQDFTHDPMLYKTIAGIVWLFELVNELCSTHSVYYYTITSFGQPQVLAEHTPASFNLIIFFTGLNALLICGFFAYRLWESTRQPALSLIVLIFALGQATLYMILTAFAFSTSSVVDLVEHKRSSLLMTFYFCLGAELFLAAVLARDLYGRRQEDFYRLASPVDRGIMWAIGTGALTSIAYAVTAVTFAVMGDNLVWNGAFVTIPRLLTLTLLVSLNSRESPYRDHLSASVNVSSLGASSAHGTFPQRSKMGALQIAVETVETTATDAASLYRASKAEHF